MSDKNPVKYKDDTDLDIQQMRSTEDQELTTYLNHHFCVPDVYCNPAVKHYLELQKYCFENVPGLSGLEIADECKKWGTNSCRFGTGPEDSQPECTIQISDFVINVGEIITANFDDVLMFIPGSTSWMRLPALFPRDCSQMSGMLYKKCPCCYCSDRGTIGSGLKTGDINPSYPSITQCHLHNNGLVYLYFPKSLEKLHLNSFIPDVVSVNIATHVYKVNVRNIITISDWGPWTPKTLMEIGKKNPIGTEDLEYGMNIIVNTLFPDFRAYKQREADSGIKETKLTQKKDNGSGIKVDIVPIILFMIFIIILFFILFNYSK